MTINELVELLVREGKLDRLIYPFQLNSNYERERYLKEEFKQELCIILLSYKKPKLLLDLYERGELDYFILKIIKNQLKSVTSPFWRTHNRWEYNREEYNLDERYDY